MAAERHCPPNYAIAFAEFIRTGEYTYIMGNEHCGGPWTNFCIGDETSARDWDASGGFPFFLKAFHHQRYCETKYHVLLLVAVPLDNFKYSNDRGMAKSMIPLQQVDWNDELTKAAIQSWASTRNFHVRMELEFPVDAATTDIPTQDVDWAHFSDRKPLRLDCVRFLSESKCNLPDYVSCIAAERSNLEVIKFLVDNGHEVDGERTIYAACVHGSLEIVKFLIGRGYQAGPRAATTAVLHRSTETVKYLVDHKQPVCKWTLDKAMSSDQLYRPIPQAIVDCLTAYSDRVCECSNDRSCHDWWY